MEEVILLRVPPAAAQLLHAELQRTQDALKPSKAMQLDLTFHDTAGKASLVIPEYGTLQAQLVDMPCAIEAYKSMDSIQHYKVADIGQMLVAQAVDDKTPIAVDYPHGLSPPTWNIRPKRFERGTRPDPKAVAEVDQMLHDVLAQRPVHIFEWFEEEVDEEEVIEKQIDDANTSKKKKHRTEAADEPPPANVVILTDLDSIPAPQTALAESAEFVRLKQELDSLRTKIRHARAQTIHPNRLIQIRKQKDVDRLVQEEHACLQRLQSLGYTDTV